MKISSVWAHRWRESRQARQFLTQTLRAALARTAIPYFVSHHSTHIQGEFGQTHKCRMTNIGCSEEPLAISAVMNDNPWQSDGDTRSTVGLGHKHWHGLLNSTCNRTIIAGRTCHAGRMSSDVVSCSTRLMVSEFALDRVVPAYRALARAHSCCSISFGTKQWQEILCRPIL